MLAQVVEQAFPSRPISDLEQASLSQHPGNQTVLVTFSDGEQAYLKFVRDGDGQRIRRAVGVLRYLTSHADIRTPRLLSAQTQEQPYYLTTAALDGEAIADRWAETPPSKRASLLYHVGQTMATLHTTPFDQSGRIVGGTADELSLKEGPWGTVLCDTIEERAETIFADRFAEFPERVNRVLTDHRKMLRDVPVSLLHGDPNRKNCLIQGNQSVALVDWEESLVGDPSFDLCRVEATHIEQPPVHDPERLRNALYAGYRKEAGDLPDGYETRHALYRVVTFLKPAQTFELWAPTAEEPTAALASWIRNEMQQRIDALD